MYGLHFGDTLNGMTFSQTVTPLGLAIPIYTATAIGGSGVNALPIFNPPNSNRNVELVSFDFDYGSGTADYGSIVLMGLPLQAAVTGALCTVFTATAPVNGYIGGGNQSRVFSSNGAGTVTVTAGTAAQYSPIGAAPGVVRTLADFNLEAVSVTAQGTGIHTYVFNGTICLPPGQMIYLAATKASVALFSMGVIWKEYLINLAAG